jgi:hypothetical protein
MFGPGHSIRSMRASGSVSAVRAPAAEPDDTLVPPGLDAAAVAAREVSMRTGVNTWGRCAAQAAAAANAMRLKRFTSERVPG